MLGRKALVLFEGSKKGNKMFGYTENYLKVEADYTKDFVNKVVLIKLSKLSESGNIIAKFE